MFRGLAWRRRRVFDTGGFPKDTDGPPGAFRLEEGIFVGDGAYLVGNQDMGFERNANSLADPPPAPTSASGHPLAP